MFRMSEALVSLRVRKRPFHPLSACVHQNDSRATRTRLVRDSLSKISQRLLINLPFLRQRVHCREHNIAPLHSESGSTVKSCGTERVQCTEGDHRSLGLHC